MYRFPCAILLAAIAAPPLAAQIAENGKDFYSNTSAVASWTFPNFWTSGNAPGDCEWKLLPASGMHNAAGQETITGFVLPVLVNNYRGGPLDLPDIELRATAESGGCRLPDFNAPPAAQVSIGTLVLPAPGAYRINVSLGSAGAIPIANGTHAVCYMATPGESAATPDSTRPFISVAGTDPDAAGCGFAKSGKYDAIGGRIIRAPRNFELCLEVAFAEPTIQPVVDRALHPDKGYGAYEMAVGPGGRTLGWHVEASQHIGHMAIPFVSFSGASRPLHLGGATVRLDVDQFLDMLIVMQQVKPVLPDGHPAGAPIEDGIMDTFDFPVPSDVIGSSIHVAAFFLDPATAAVAGATNTCTTRFVRR
jgi:hypothetical protein